MATDISRRICRICRRKSTTAFRCSRTWPFCVGVALQYKVLCLQSTITRDFVLVFCYRNELFSKKGLFGGSVSCRTLGVVAVEGGGMESVSERKFSSSFCSVSTIAFDCVFVSAAVFFKSALDDAGVSSYAVLSSPCIFCGSVLNLSMTRLSCDTNLRAVSIDF